MSEWGKKIVTWTEEECAGVSTYAHVIQYLFMTVAEALFGATVRISFHTNLLLRELFEQFPSILFVMQGSSFQFRKKIIT